MSAGPPPVGKPDATQVIMGADFRRALQEVGIIPPDVYTHGAATIEIGDHAVTIKVDIVVPMDKLQEALRLVERRKAADKNPLCRCGHPRDEHFRGSSVMAVCRECDCTAFLRAA